MSEPRLHVIGLPHTETTPRYSHCAYTSKISKFCRMFPNRVMLYAGAENVEPCLEHVPLITKSERIHWFGEWDAQTAMSKVTWDRNHPAWVTLNARAILALRDRLQPQDLILLTGGHCQQPIAGAYPAHLSLEWAVGYEGIFANFCAFESLAWMHHVYGLRGIRHGRWYDAVIPNFFDPSEFRVSRSKDDFLLYLGRVMHDKGVGIAADLAKALKRTLVIAGGCVTKHTTRRGVTTVVGDGITVEGRHIEYVGPVDGPTRADLLTRASVVLCPTLYVEPFGGVAVEAMLSGTPVVSSDWGAFTETVQPGVTGFRFRTLREGVDAIKSAEWLVPSKIRAHALARYALPAVRPLFERWFGQVSGLWGEGWTSLSPAQGISGVHSRQLKRPA